MYIDNVCMYVLHIICVCTIHIYVSLSLDTYIYIYIYIYIKNTALSSRRRRGARAEVRVALVRPVHLLKVFLLRVPESNFPGDPL